MRQLTHRGQEGPGRAEGVSRADVSLRAKEAVIVFEPAQATVEQMADAVNRLGFHASVKGTQPSLPRMGR